MPYVHHDWLARLYTARSPPPLSNKYLSKKEGAPRWPAGDAHAAPLAVDAHGVDLLG